MILHARTPVILDIVAVVNPPRQPGVLVGDVGTVVEVLDPDGLEVEFLDPDGRTRCVATLNVEDVLILNRNRSPIG